METSMNQPRWLPGSMLIYQRVPFHSMGGKKKWHCDKPTKNWWFSLWGSIFKVLVGFFHDARAVWLPTFGLSGDEIFRYSMGFWAAKAIRSFPSWPNLGMGHSTNLGHGRPWWVTLDKKENVMENHGNCRGYWAKDSFLLNLISAGWRPQRVVLLSFQLLCFCGETHWNSSLKYLHLRRISCALRKHQNILIDLHIPSHSCISIRFFFAMSHPSYPQQKCNFP